MKKTILSLFLCGSLFAGTTYSMPTTLSKGHLEIGLNTLDYQMENKDGISKSSQFDNYGIDFNMLNRIGNKLYAGFNSSYITGDTIQGNFDLFDVEGVLKYVLNATKKYEFGISGGFGWKYLQDKRTVSQDINYIYGKTGIYGNYFFNKDIKAGATLDYSMSLYQELEEPVGDLRVSSTLSNASGISYGFMTGFRMEKTTWLIVDYTASNFDASQNGEITKILLTNDKIGVKVRWEW